MYIYWSLYISVHFQFLAALAALGLPWLLTDWPFYSLLWIQSLPALPTKPETSQNWGGLMYMEVDEVADMMMDIEVDKVADKVVDMVMKILFRTK